MLTLALGIFMLLAYFLGPLPPGTVFHDNYGWIRYMKTGSLVQQWIFEQRMLEEDYERQLRHYERQEGGERMDNRTPESLGRER